MKIFAPLFYILFCCSLCFVGCADPSHAKTPSQTHYDIQATLLPSENALLVTTEITCAAPAEGISALKLRLYAATYSEGNSAVGPAKVREAYGKVSESYGNVEIQAVEGEVPVQDYDLGQDGSILTIRFGRKFKKGESIRLSITERIKLAKIKHHLGHYDGYYSLAHFYPELCPFRDGKFFACPLSDHGDPFSHERADFTLQLTLPAEYECASSAEEIGREKQGTERHLTYTLSGARDISLVASKKLRSVSASYDGIFIKYYYENDAHAAKTLKKIEDGLALYSRLFGTYPYASYTVVSMPFCEAGAEHSALSVVSNALSELQREEVILHETAHQWWYGKVGNDEYTYPWLDEGLAEFSVACYYREKAGENAYRAQINKAREAFSIRLAIKGQDGVRFDKTLAELNEGYYDRVYCGALLLYAELAEKVGYRPLLAALLDYACRYDGKTATPNALISSLSASLGQDLTDFFQTWLTAALPIE